MAIVKQSGDDWGVKPYELRHAGPARTATVMITIVPARLTGHGDPLDVPSEQRKFQNVQLPVAGEETVTSFPEIKINNFPGLDAGKYDVNFAVGESLSGGSLGTWYGNRGGDDWDDDVYEVRAADPFVRIEGDEVDFF